ncbi:MAG TPA: hypothetical protein VGE98_01580, partial [Thermoanaerobaculia bacterium]
MSPLHLAILDKLIALVVAAVLVTLYLSPRLPRFHRRKWVLIVAVLPLFYCVYGLLWIYNRVQEAPPPLPSPPPGDVKVVETPLTALTKDVLFASPDGYHILIPAGFKYFTSGPSQMSLAAVHEGSSVAVFKIDADQALDAFVKQTEKALQATNASYRFEPAAAIQSGTAAGRRVAIAVEKDGKKYAGTLLLFQRGK